MLPVLAGADWQVEAVIVDLGTGLRKWFEVRHDGEVAYCASRDEVAALLLARGLRFEDFAEVDPEAGVNDRPSVGCGSFAGGGADAGRRRADTAC